MMLMRSAGSAHAGSASGLPHNDRAVVANATSMTCSLQDWIATGLSSFSKMPTKRPSKRTPSKNVRDECLWSTFSLLNALVGINAFAAN